MGEKEQGTARESSAPSLSERDAGSGQAGGITGDPDFDRARASSVKSAKSNTSDRLASGDLPTDAAGDEDEDGDAARGPRTSSNIQNNRGAALTHEDDWEPPASLASGDLQRSGPIRLDSTPARVAEGGGSDIAIGDPGVNGN